MRIEDFDYELPVQRIAQHPVEPRDSARLLVDRGAAEPDHRHVRDLPELLAPGDLIVVNETRVIPGRLHLKRRTGGAVEVLLLEALDGDWSRWEAMVRPGRRLRDGEMLVDHDGHATLIVHSRGAHGDTFIVEIVRSETNDHALSDDPIAHTLARLEAIGEMPLPPYIEAELTEPDRYQTVFARHPGSAAAPTAGLHLTEALIESLAQRGISMCSVELMVGRDTFVPISEADPLDHPIHSERYRVPAATLEACAAARAGGHRVVAIGTTSVRALESAASTGELSGRTSLYISRGYDWRVVDVMMTNFHLPRTTLLVMIEAFVGERWRRLYQEALSSGYRFASFGDAMLLTRSPMTG
jgi:S-adenosylmethionine:tRNA ribosyltransferase-isomerase